MFTGIVEEIAQIKSIKKKDKGKEFVFKFSVCLKKLKIGESIAINGVCQSIIVSNYTKKEITTYSSSETLSMTTFDSLKVLQYVNIEYPLRLSDFINGHLVQGHVDTIARIMDIKKIGNHYCICFELQDKEFFKYLIYKGSITVDGVSLTINQLIPPKKFMVMIIPVTWKKSIFSYYNLYDSVNIETDLIGKYIYNFIE